MRHFIVTTLLIFGISSNSNAAIYAISASGTPIFSPDVKTLAQAATAPTLAGASIHVTSALSPSFSNISSASMHSWPSDRTLVIEKGGTINPTTKFTGLPTSKPEWFGTGSAAYNAAIASLVDGGILDARAPGDVTFTAQVTINKHIKVLLGGGTITGPGSGWIFDITANDVKIEGMGGTLKLSKGGAGGIRNNESLRTTITDIRIDMNNVAGAIGLHHNAGWYNDYRNIEIDKAKTHAASTGLRINGTTTYPSCAGKGSCGGAWIGQYTNIVAKNLVIAGGQGSDANTVTTQTFINPDFGSVNISRAVGITMLQPIVQAMVDGDSLFTLNYVSNLTLLGGDFEASDRANVKLFTFISNVTAVNSIGNAVSGTDMIYMVSQPNAASYFNDKFGTTNPTVGLFHGYIGSSEDLTLGNYSYINKHHIGTQYDGNVFNITNNLKQTGTSTGTLDDTAKGAVSISTNTSGGVKIQTATAGANPRTLTTLVDLSAGAGIYSGSGTPEGVVTAASGSIYLNIAGGAGTSFYVKQSGSANTGWVGK